MDQLRLRVRIRGQVQGVFFRQSTRQQARRLGVRGWVTNRSDGSVEAVFAGSEAAVRELLEWARHGPAEARVDELHSEDAGAVEVPAGFDIR